MKPYINSCLSSKPRLSGWSYQTASTVIFHCFASNSASCIFSAAIKNPSSLSPVLHKYFFIIYFVIASPIFLIIVVLARRLLFSLLASSAVARIAIIPASIGRFLLFIGKSIRSHCRRVLFSLSALRFQLFPFFRLSFPHKTLISSANS